MESQLEKVNQIYFNFIRLEIEFKVMPVTATLNFSVFHKLDMIFTLN